MDTRHELPIIQLSSRANETKPRTWRKFELALNFSLPTTLAGIPGETRVSRVVNMGKGDM